MTDRNQKKNNGDFTSFKDILAKHISDTKEYQDRGFTAMNEIKGLHQSIPKIVEQHLIEFKEVGKTLAAMCEVMSAERSKFIDIVTMKDHIPIKTHSYVLKQIHAVYWLIIGGLVAILKLL